MQKAILLFIVIILASCSSNSVPSNILPLDEMRPILWQQFKADIYTRENLAMDTSKKYDLKVENEKLQMQIFNNYGITKEKFYESYKYYLHHENELNIMLDSMIAYQTRLNFEEITRQNLLNANNPMNNIFWKDFLKMEPKTIFTMMIDSLPKLSNQSILQETKRNIFKGGRAHPSNNNFIPPIHN